MQDVPDLRTFRQPPGKHSTSGLPANDDPQLPVQVPPTATLLVQSPHVPFAGSRALLGEPMHTASKQAQEKQQQQQWHRQSINTS